MLPQITLPTFSINIPSTKQASIFRPFLVREEKILLIAQEGDDADILRAIKQIVSNCSVDKLDINKLTTFDLEYLFLKLHAKSVNNIAKLSYKDGEDDKVYEFEVDLDKIEVEFNEDNNKKIKVNDTVGIVMKYMSADVSEKIKKFENEIELLNFFIINSMDTVYDENSVYQVSEFKDSEVTEFIDSLPAKAFNKIKKFFETMPKLEHVINYKNSLGTDRTIKLRSVKDFFMWG
jgi:hypothetical protein